MGTPHKHAAVIKAWANGAEIERRDPKGADQEWREWRINATPAWFTEYDYRVKPEPHKWQKEMDAAKAGKTIQYRVRCAGAAWTDWGGAGMYADHPRVWSESYEFRIKPEKVEQKWYVDKGQHLWMPSHVKSNLLLTFEDGKLVAAEVI